MVLLSRLSPFGWCCCAIVPWWWAAFPSWVPLPSKMKQQRKNRNTQKEKAGKKHHLDLLRTSTKKRLKSAGLCVSITRRETNIYCTEHQKRVFGEKKRKKQPTNFAKKKTENWKNANIPPRPNPTTRGGRHRARVSTPRLPLVRSFFGCVGARWSEGTMTVVVPDTLCAYAGSAWVL